MQPPSGIPDPKHADAVLQGHGDIVGKIQDGLAGVVDGNLATNAQAVKQMRQSLAQRGTRGVNHLQGLVNQIAGNLATATGSAVQTIADSVSSLSSAAVSGELGPSSFPPQAPAAPAPQQPAVKVPVKPFDWCVVYNCVTGVLETQARLDANTTPPPGWKFVLCGFADQGAAGDWIKANDATWVPPPGFCDPVPPAGGGAGAGVGGGNVTLNPPPACWTGGTFIGAVGGGVHTFAPSSLPVQYFEAGAQYCAYFLTWQQPGGKEQVWVTPTPYPYCFTAVGDHIKDTNAAMDVVQLVLNSIPDYKCNPVVPACPPPPECPKLVAPPPPPACATTIPVLNCPVLVNGQLPLVGSLEWCQCIEGLSAWFDDVGQWLVDKIDGILAPGNQDDPTSQLQTIASTVGGQILGFAGLSGIKESITSAVATNNCVWQALKDASLQFAAKTSARLLGISVCRALLNAFSKLRLGWDLAVWGTIDLSVHLNPLLQLIFYIENYNFQYDIPSVGDAIECLIQHTVPHDQGVCWMACHGANFETWLPVIEARREKLSPHELIEFNRRHKATDEQIQHRLQAQGWIRKEEAAARVELSYELPTIHDHLHWLQRNVFDKDYVDNYDLLNGFETKFWPAFGPDLHALGMRKEYAERHYAAHWIIPSEGKLAEMAQRLRPGRVDDSIAFSWEDYRTLLAEQDVAPYYRERLENVAFRTLPLRQLNAATQQGRFDRAELVNRWQDIGFAEIDANTLADTSLVQAARQVAAQIHGYTAAFVSELLAYGLIDLDGADKWLSPQGYSKEQINTLASAALARKTAAQIKRHTEGTINAYSSLALKAYAEGAVTSDNARMALVDAGYSDQAAALALATVDLRTQMDTLKAAVNATHRAFRLGAVDASGALSTLLLAGVVQPMASTYVSRWQLEMTVPRIAASTGMILRWARKGIMSVANARTRLVNLGWNGPDIELQIAEIEQDLLAAEKRAESKAADQLANAQRRAKMALQASQKSFCKLFTPAKMVKWYAERIIDDADFQRKLEQCGYNAESIHDLILEAKVAREAADVKAQAKGTLGNVYTGQGAITG